VPALRHTVSGTPGKEQLAFDHASNLEDHLHDIHNYARKHLKLASDWMENSYGRLSNCEGYHEGNRV
jgi:hypothetical protein